MKWGNTNFKLICNCLNCNTAATIISLFKKNCASAVHVIRSFHDSFHSRVKMNSTNWPAPNLLVFIAQLVEHCSAKA